MRGSRTLGCFPYLFRRGRIESVEGVVFGLCDAEPDVKSSAREPEQQKGGCCFGDGPLLELTLSGH